MKMFKSKNKLIKNSLLKNIMFIAAVLLDNLIWLKPQLLAACQNSLYESRPVGECAEFYCSVFCSV